MRYDCNDVLTEGTSSLPLIVAGAFSSCDALIAFATVSHYVAFTETLTVSAHCFGWCLIFFFISLCSACRRRIAGLCVLQTFCVNLRLHCPASKASSTSVGVKTIVSNSHVIRDTVPRMIKEYKNAPNFRPPRCCRWLRAGRPDCV